MWSCDERMEIIIKQSRLIKTGMQFRPYGSHFTFAVLNCSWLHLLRFPSQTFYHEETEKEIIFFS